jgi:hypothetical protein
MDHEWQGCHHLFSGIRCILTVICQKWIQIYANVDCWAFTLSFRNLINDFYRSSSCSFQKHKTHVADFDNCLPKNLRRLIYTHHLELMKLLGSNGSIVVPLYPPLGLIILPFLDRSREWLIHCSAPSSSGLLVENNVTKMKNCERLPQCFIWFGLHESYLKHLMFLCSWRSLG